jgi:hypothetical protein
MPFVWSDAVLLHDPRHEVRVGRETPAPAPPRRPGPLRSTRSGSAGTDRLPAGLHLPAALVQEGGYPRPTRGGPVADVLAGFAPWNE